MYCLKEFMVESLRNKVTIALGCNLTTLKKLVSSLRDHSRCCSAPNKQSFTVS